MDFLRKGVSPSMEEEIQLLLASNLEKLIRCPPNLPE
jgi:hypothetical protein